MSLSQSQMTQEITGPVVAVAEDEEQGDPVPTDRPAAAPAAAAAAAPSSQRTSRRAEPGAGDEAAAAAAAQQLLQAGATTRDLTSVSCAFVRFPALVAAGAKLDSRKRASNSTWPRRKAAAPASERGGTRGAAAAAAGRVPVGLDVDGGGGAEEADERAPDRLRVGRHPDAAQAPPPAPQRRRRRRRRRPQPEV